MHSISISQNTKCALKVGFRKSGHIYVFTRIEVIYGIMKTIVMFSS